MNRELEHQGEEIAKVDAEVEIARLRKALERISETLDLPPAPASRYDHEISYRYAGANGKAKAIAELALELETRWSGKR